MPILLEEQTVDIQPSDLFARRPISRPFSPHARSPGIHLSGVLAAVAQRIGVLKPGAPWDDELPLRMVVGHMWEEFAVSLYPEIDWQPGEICVDGVWMTADGIQAGGTPHCGADVLHEFKATWKRTRSGAEMLEEWYWMRQGMGYSHGYGVRHVWWHVLFVNGDYRDSGPQYKRYLIEFSDKEIEQTWTMVCNHKHLAVAE